MRLRTAGFRPPELAPHNTFNHRQLQTSFKEITDFKIANAMRSSLHSSSMIDQLLNPCVLKTRHWPFNSQKCSSERYFVLLRSESPSGKCAKLHTVAASNNRDHAPRSLFGVTKNAMCRCKLNAGARFTTPKIGTTFMAVVRVNFYKANTLISPDLGMLLNVVYGDLTSCPYLIKASLSGGCNTVQLQCFSFYNSYTI